MDESELDTVLAEDIDFEGTLSFTKPLMIKGRFRGEIKALGDLYINDSADVEAQITANSVSLRGRLKGNVHAAAKAELFSSANVEGDITAMDIVMESGCRFNGVCRMLTGGKVNA